MDKQAASRNSLASGNWPGLEVPFPCPGSSAFLSFLSITDFTQERVLVTSEATAGWPQGCFRIQQSDKLIRWHLLSFQQNFKFLQLKWVETSWWPGCAQMGDPQEMTPTRTYREPLFITIGPPESPGLWKLNLSHLRSGPWEVGVCRRQIDHQRGVPFQSSSTL